MRQRNGSEVAHSREFNRDFVGEENFAKAMVRLREVIAVSEISDDSKELAAQSLTEEIRVKFQVLLSEKEAVIAVLNATLMHGDEFFKLKQIVIPITPY